MAMSDNKAETAEQILRKALAEIDAMDSAQSAKSTEKKIGEWFNDNWLSAIITLATIGLSYYFLQFSPSEAEKIYSKVSNIGFLWASVAIFKIFWRGVSHDQDQVISQDGRATAIYIGATIIGTALVIAFG